MACPETLSTGLGYGFGRSLSKRRAGSDFFLREKNLINYFIDENDQINKIDLEFWFKNRIFFSFIYRKGLNDYIKDILFSNSKEPFKDVEINPFFGSIDLITTSNQIILEKLNDIAKKNPRIISKKRLDAINQILNPPKDFEIQYSKGKW